MNNVINFSSSTLHNFTTVQELSRTPKNIQGQQNIFQESRTQRLLIANSRKVLGAQGRLATLLELVPGRVRLEIKSFLCW